jgi:hypothetical protein
MAAALAKAQAQLVNPEKSLIGTIRTDGQGAAKRSFRYAPLSSGLDIVRKTLSQHEIATLQTASVAGMYVSADSETQGPTVSSTEIHRHAGGRLARLRRQISCVPRLE